MFKVLGAQDPATTVKIVEVLHSVFAGFNAPTTWAVMLAGLAIVGLAFRDRRSLNLGEI
jgi:ATP-dependent Clp protease adapter protein ClpS